MKYNSIVKVAVAVALLFAVNINADAQLGKLKGLAKKAVETVTNVDNVESTTQVTEAPVSNDPYANMSPRYREIKRVEAAGGMDKFLGMTEGDEAVVYKYYDKYGTGYNYKITGAFDEGKKYGHDVAEVLVNIFRIVKEGNKDADLQDCKGADPYSMKRFFHPFTIKDATGTHKVASEFDKMMQESVKDDYDGVTKKKYIKMPQADVEAFKRVAAKAKQAYEAKFGVIEPLD